MYSHLLAVFLFLGCLENQSDLEKRCTPVLQEILDIQDMRDTLREDFKKITQRYREKRSIKFFGINKKILGMKKRTVWLVE